MLQKVSLPHFNLYLLSKIKMQEGEKWPAQLDHGNGGSEVVGSLDYCDAPLVVSSHQSRLLS